MAKKAKPKNKSFYTKKLQKLVNEYVRLRDDNRTCISCDLPTVDMSNKAKHAGHYRSIGSCPEMRFNTCNIHLQCYRCNIFLSGNVVEYRKNLIERYGSEFVEALEYKQQLKKYSKFDLERMCDIFKRKISLYKRLFRNEY